MSTYQQVPQSYRSLDVKQLEMNVRVSIVRLNHIMSVLDSFARLQSVVIFVNFAESLFLITLCVFELQLVIISPICITQHITIMFTVEFYFRPRTHQITQCVWYSPSYWLVNCLCSHTIQHVLLTRNVQSTTNIWPFQLIAYWFITGRDCWACILFHPLVQLSYSNAAYANVNDDASAGGEANDGMQDHLLFVGDFQDCTKYYCVKEQVHFLTFSYIHRYWIRSDRW